MVRLSTFHQITSHNPHSSGTTVYGEPAIGNDAMSVAECDEGEVVMRLEKTYLHYL